jgi:hypothetical protein
LATVVPSLRTRLRVFVFVPPEAVLVRLIGISNILFVRTLRGSLALG